MQKLNNHIRLLFFLSLGSSIGFPLGVLGIVFGAVNGIIPLLVIGIVLAVIGFYGMPLLWIKYADRRHDRTILLMIENEYLYTVSGLARQTGFSENDVRTRIKKMILSRVLVGYLFEDDTLRLNTNSPQMGNAGRTRPCECCGAIMRFEDHSFICDYCRNTAPAD